MAAVQAAADGYVPFAVRFRAWWEGMDPHALLARTTESAKRNPLAIEIDASSDESAELAPRWPDNRIRFCRRLWGDDPDDETVHPGGASRTLSLMKPMCLTRECSSADLTAGLGGGIRLAATELNTYVDGLEQNGELAARAHELSRRHGMERRAGIRHYNQENLDLPDRRYTGILCRERTYTVTNKTLFLEQAFTALKPGGHLVLTAFAVQTPSDAGSPAIDAWASRDPDFYQLWTVDDYATALIRFGMEMRIKQDETEQFRAMLLKGWAQFVDGLSKPDLTREFVNDMMREAEYWLMLIRALESGKLRYYRYHAIRGMIVR